MALPLWGQQEKSQDSTQTIEEAIAEAIANHEADSEAHLGSGESLETHKQEDIIDHPAGSVLPDKWTFSDLDFETNFETLTPFDISAGVTNNSWPGVEFDIFDGGGDLRTLKANLVGLITGSTLDYDFLLDVYFNVDSADDNEILDFGISDNAMTTRYLGFRVTGGNLYGVARWGGSENLTSNLGNVSDGTVKFVRVFYSASLDVVTFYLNGSVVGTLQPASAIQLSNQLSIYADDNGAEGTVLRVYKVFLARSI